MAAHFGRALILSPLHRAMTASVGEGGRTVRLLYRCPPYHGAPTYCSICPAGSSRQSASLQTTSPVSTCAPEFFPPLIDAQSIVVVPTAYRAAAGRITITFDFKLFNLWLFSRKRRIFLQALRSNHRLRLLGVAGSAVTPLGWVLWRRLVLGSG